MKTMKIRGLKKRIKELKQNSEFIQKIEEFKQTHTKIDEKGKSYIDSNELKAFVFQLQCQRKW